MPTTVHCDNLPWHNVFSNNNRCYKRFSLFCTFLTVRKRERERKRNRHNYKAVYFNAMTHNIYTETTFIINIYKKYTKQLILTSVKHLKREKYNCVVFILFQLCKQSDSIILGN